MIHKLKTDHEIFKATLYGEKSFEIRKDDRGFKVGDELQLRETVSTGAQMKQGSPLMYTNRIIIVTVLHILRGPIYGLIDGWVIMSIKRV